jgi:hypothetical protein
MEANQQLPWSLALPAMTIRLTVHKLRINCIFDFDQFSAQSVLDRVGIRICSVALSHVLLVFAGQAHSQHGGHVLREVTL